MNELEDVDEFASLMGKLLTFRVNEPILRANLERDLSPSPAVIAKGSEQIEEVNRTLKKLSDELGGAPEFYVVPAGQEKKRVYDEYGSAALSEIVNYFPRVQDSRNKCSYLDDCGLVAKKSS